jgi:CRISPR-associated protein Csm3
MTISTTNKPQRQLLGKFYFKSILLVETGLHIGGGGETLNIGGIDKPVIRDPITRHPYLPGSSIKGKLRAILERLLNKPLNRQGSRDTYRYESGDLVDGIVELGGQHIKFQGAKTCELSRVFGSTGVKCWIETELASQEKLPYDKSQNKLIDGKEYANVTGRNFPARLIVRDAHLHKDSVQKLETIDTGLYMTEWKFENGIDRITAAANPRQVERVPKGAKFNFEMVYTVENGSQARDDLRNILRAIMVLEDDALGGHGSRGYGKIKFQNLEFCYRDYAAIGKPGSSSLSLPSSNKLSGIEDTSQLSDKFDDLQKLLPE